MKNTQTFIFVHNQDIIIDYINSGKFNKLTNLKYVFLGNNPIDKVVNNDSVIIARNQPYNIENYPKLTSYTGWYVIWKNKLYNSDYINLFEYDVNILDSFYEYNNLEDKPNITGYIGIKINNPNLFMVEKWAGILVRTIKEHYNIDLLDSVKGYTNEEYCSVTSNHTFEKSTFERYMEWVDPLIPEISKSPLSGHQVERSIIAFYLLNKIQHKLNTHMITHLQLDSHKTQYANDKFSEMYNKLLK